MRMKMRLYEANLEIRLAIGDDEMIRAARGEGRLTSAWCREYGVRFVNIHTKIDISVALNNVNGFWPIGSIYDSKYHKH